jgi:hypothetical protein
MNIRVEAHTLDRAIERGASHEEIVDTITTGTKAAAKAGRMSATKVFPFKNLRLGKFYEQKKIEVIFFSEPEQLITVTVYVYYGTWEAAP